MIRWLQSPKSSKVSNYIKNYWLIEKSPGSTSYQYPKLNPDPSAHLLISPINQPYHYDIAPVNAIGRGSHWLFPHHQTIALDHSKPFIHLGVKFHVGALYSLDMPSSIHPTLDTVTKINITNLLNTPELSVQKLIGLAQSDSKQCCDQLDALFLPWLNNSREDQHSELTRKALKLLDKAPISELGSMLHCSQRTVERSFSRVTGLTLKQCLTMNKLEMMLEYLYQRDVNDIEWVEIAYQFGFSDQPHLIRHLKKQIGLTPKAYAKERGLTIDVYGGIKSI